MKKLSLIYLLLAPIFFVNAQEITTSNNTDTIPMIQYDSVKIANDSINNIIEEHLLSEIFIGIDPEEELYRKNMNTLRNRILRVYPYAKITEENLVIINANLDKMQTKKQKNDYIKRSQNYLEKEFEERLKKLSRNDGKILIKLIHRQTGSTTYSLIKEFKSSWKAFWSNKTAKLFSLDLKSEYHPDQNLEDFYIETQLNFLFFNHYLIPQEAKPPINFNSLRISWKDRIGETYAYPLELRE